MGTTRASNGRQLLVRTKVRTGLGEEKVVTALVDTGAQVNLVKKSLFGEEAFVPAKCPVDLRSISGDKVEGGRMVIPLRVTFRAEDWTTKEEWEESLKGEFYEANIAVDMILGWPFLQGHHLGVVPHKKQLLWEYPNDRGWGWLSGCSSKVAHQRGVGMCSTSPSGMRPTSQKWRTRDYAVRQEVVEEIIKKFGCEVPVLDAFATPENRRFPKFWDLKKDAFSQNWNEAGFLWVNPPFDVMDRVVEKLVQEKVKAIVVAPVWKHMVWWKKIGKYCGGFHGIDPSPRTLLALRP